MLPAAGSLFLVLVTCKAPYVPPHPQVAWRMAAGRTPHRTPVPYPEPHKDKSYFPIYMKRWKYRADSITLIDQKLVKLGPLELKLRRDPYVFFSTQNYTWLQWSQLIRGPTHTQSVGPR